MMFNMTNIIVFKRSGFFLILHGLLLLLLLSSIPVLAQEKLLVFAGAASKPPTEEVAAQYEKKTGVKVDLVFGGSGYVLAQMKLSKQGDIYFPGSSDYMEIAKRDGNVFADTEKIIVYLVPAINVQKGNPHNIKKLIDLTKPGINVAIANPEGVCLGVYAVEIIEKEFTADEKEAFKNNLINYTSSCEKTATAISLKQADAVIGWGVLEHWDPERIETIKLDQKQIPRVGYIPIAIAKYTKNKKAAQDFINFLVSDEGSAIFKKYHYFSTPQEAFAYIGVEKPVGGEYVVPAEWLLK
jgi:molybdate transport system substrate-binding protein